jgi:uncharacterized cupin superfamily protein
MNKRLIHYLSTKTSLEPGNIKSEWIIEGEPKIKSSLLSSSADGLSFVVVWECTAGKFRWGYNFDEVLYILEGSVTLDDGTNAPRTVKAGDVLFIPKGSSAIWTVHSHIRKLAVCRHVLPAALAVPIKWLRWLKAALRGSQRDTPLAGSATTEGVAAR